VVPASCGTLPSLSRLRLATSHLFNLLTVLGGYLDRAYLLLVPESHCPPKDYSSGRRRDQGQPLRPREEPREPHRHAARQARRAEEEGSFAPVQDMGVEGGPAGGVQGRVSQRGRGVARRVAARRRVLQDQARRRRREEGAQAQGRRGRGG